MRLYSLKSRFIGGLIIPVVFAGFAALAMLLWNALVPQIFGLPEINYLQMAGLLILARIMFGGLLPHSQFKHGEHPWDHRHRGDPRVNDLRSKWMNMSEEERKAFINKEKDFMHFHRKCSHVHDFFDDDDTRPDGGESAPKNEGKHE